MKAELRRQAQAGLRALRLEATYLIERLSASPRTQVLAHGLKARAEAIEIYLAKESQWSLGCAQWLAVESAREDGGLCAEAEPEHHARLGELRAERTRLDARMQAELQAYATTRRVLDIRLSGLRA